MVSLVCLCTRLTDLLGRLHSYFACSRNSPYHFEGSIAGTVILTSLWLQAPIHGHYLGRYLQAVDSRLFVRDMTSRVGWLQFSCIFRGHQTASHWLQLASNNVFRWLRAVRNGKVHVVFADELRRIAEKHVNWRMRLVIQCLNLKCMQLPFCWFQMHHLHQQAASRHPAFTLDTIHAETRKSNS